MAEEAVLRSRRGQPSVVIKSIGSLWLIRNLVDVPVSKVPWRMVLQGSKSQINTLTANDKAIYLFVITGSSSHQNTAQASSSWKFQNCEKCLFWIREKNWFSTLVLQLKPKCVTFVAAKANLYNKIRGKRKQFSGAIEYAIQFIPRTQKKWSKNVWLVHEGQIAVMYK